MSASNATGKTGDRRRDSAARILFDHWCADLKRRLGRTCADMPRREFDDLVIRMNRIRFKYESVSAVPREHF